MFEINKELEQQRATIVRNLEECAEGLKEADSIRAQEMWRQGIDRLTKDLRCLDDKMMLLSLYYC